MAIYLDSAIVAEARQAAKFGWIRGLTTNPNLLAKSKNTPLDTLRALAAAMDGEIFVQLMAPTTEGMLSESRAIEHILGRQAVLKIPATLAGFQAATTLSLTFPCAITAVYSPAQAVIAAEAGARYVIPYVNRSTRLQGDGIELVKRIAALLAGSPTSILAASIKSPGEAIATLLAGADHITLPFQVLVAMAQHDLSDQAIEDFHHHGSGVD